MSLTERSVRRSPKLDKRTRKAIDGVVKRHGQGEFKEASDGPTFITERTYHALCAEFSLSDDSSHPGLRPPFSDALRVAEEYSQYFGDTFKNNGFLYQFGSWLDSLYKGHLQEMALKDSAFAGAAYVLKAFHMECGPEFMDRLKELNPKDLLTAFSSSGPGFPQRASIIDRARNVKGIPDYQAFLNTGLNQLIADNHTQFERAVADGAYGVYNVIDKLWPSLKHK